MTYGPGRPAESVRAGCSDAMLERRFNAATALFLAGEIDSARLHFLELADLAPHLAAVHANLILVQLSCGQLHSAVATAERALSDCEPSPDLLSAVGQAMAAAGHRAAAIQAYEAAIDSDPELRATTLINLASLHLEAGDLAASESCLESLSDNTAATPDATALLAAHRHASNDHDAAIEIYRRLLRQVPDMPDATIGLAVCLAETGRLDEAARQLNGLLTQPQLSQAMRAAAALNLGHCYYRQGQNERAISAFENALPYHQNRLAVTPFLVSALNLECRWQESRPLRRELLDSAADPDSFPAVPPFALIGLGVDAETLALATRKYADEISTKTAPVPALHNGPHCHRTGRLRIGYISPDFDTHSVGAFIRDLMPAHNRDRIEWYGYRLGASDNADSRAIAALFDRFSSQNPFATAENAQQIAADELDLLVDLSGYTRNNALSIMAWRPAPVQAHYFGYGQSLGLDWIDYLVTDEIAMPAPVYEPVAYLPHSFLALAPAGDKLPTVAPAHMVYGSFNAVNKLDAEQFDDWLRILAAVPNSLLRIACGSDSALQRLKALAERNGVDAARLIAAPFIPRPEHLQRLTDIGLVLDTNHHNGGATTLDALSMNVPVLTLAGDAPSKRTGASILYAAGMPDLVKRNREDYIADAIAIGTDVNRRQNLRDRLSTAQHCAPLFDMKSHAASLERAYRTMIDRNRHGQAAATFTVPA